MASPRLFKKAVILWGRRKPNRTPSWLVAAKRGRVYVLATEHPQSPFSPHRMCTRTPTAVVVQHNTRMHLTNYAINKGSKNFVPPGGTARAGGRPPPPPPAHTADTPSRTSREDGARVVAAAQDNGPTEGAVSV